MGVTWNLLTVWLGLLIVAVGLYAVNPALLLLPGGAAVVVGLLLSDEGGGG